MASLWPSPFLSIFAFSYFFILLKKYIFHVPIVYVLCVLVIVVGGVCVCMNANPITRRGVRNQLVDLVLYFHHAGPRD